MACLVRLEKKQFLLLLIVFLTALFSAAFVSAGCCLIGSQFDESGQIIAPLPLTCSAYSAGMPLTQELCEEGFGTWDEAECVDLEVAGGVCEKGCCCLDNKAYGDDPQQQIAQYACFAPAIFSPFEEGKTCVEICGETQATTYYALTGTVLYEDGGSAVDDAEVTLSKRTGVFTQRVATTAGDGLFSFVNLESAPDYRVTVLATNPAGQNCQGASDTDITLTTDVDVIIELTCTDDPIIPPCIPDWYCSYTTSPECGRPYDECVDNLACGIPYPGTFPEGPSCGSATCNGALEPGELCDGTEFPGTNSCSAYGNYNAGTVTCPDCYPDTSGCTNCPPDPNPNSCSTTQCEQCPNCASNAMCTTTEECNDVLPVFTGDSPQHVPEEPTLVLYWTYATNCAHEVNGITITRTADDGEPNILVYESYQNDLNDGSLSYRDEGLTAGVRYCYEVSMLVEQDGNIEPKTTTTSYCAPLGDEECLEEHAEELCVLAGDCPADVTCVEGDSWRARCDNTNQRILLTGNDGPFFCGTNACLGPSNNGKTVCANTEVCDSCSGLYGMYSYLNFDSATSFDVNFVEFPGEDPLPADCYDFVNPDEQPLCFSANKQTIVDTLNKCDLVSSCYDYTSSVECASDPCEQIQGYNCQWEPFATTLGQQTGLGVCVPQVAGRQECDRCDKDNGILPACTGDLCDAYSARDDTGLLDGGRCYYALSSGTCGSETDMGCEGYNDEPDCIGVEANEQNVSVVVEYDDNDLRVSGSNTKTPSHDLFNFGACMWVGGAKPCVKNTDNYLDKFLRTDCAAFTESADIKRCQSDFEPPRTIIQLVNETNQPFSANYPAYSTKNLVFDHSAIDNEYEPSTLQTFYILRARGATGYPSRTYEELTTASFPPVVALFEIAYFSQDPALNLEPIRTTPIILDTLPPYLTITDEKAPFLYAEDDYRTNVTVTWSVTEDHGPVECTRLLARQIEQDGTFINDPVDEEVITIQSALSPQTFVETFNYLEDGKYVVALTCNDNPFLNNEQETLLDIELNADQSITNPFPYKGKFSQAQDLTISIETDRPAQCYYTDQTSRDVATTDDAFTQSTDKLRHTAQVTGLGQGVQVYAVACEFEHRPGTLKQGSEADKILFSIDMTAPSTELINTITGEAYGDNEPWADSVQLGLNCTDNNPNLWAGTSWDGNFGPATVHYCISDEETSNCEPYEEVDALPIPTVRFDKSDSIGKHLYYYCVDQGGNQEGGQGSQGGSGGTDNPTHTKISVKDTNFPKPQVRVFAEEDLVSP